MNPVNWFEIYVDDMPRAKKFYETVLGRRLTKIDSPELEMYGFQGDMNSYGANGALCKMDGLKAGGASTMVYFHSEDCSVEEKRFAAAGGKITKPKFSIGQYGFICIGMDSEGNAIGIHSMK